MAFDINSPLNVDGKISATEQAESENDVVLLDSNAQIPGTMIPNVTLAFSIPTSAWSGSGPYTATVTVAGLSAIATPLVGPDAPTVAVREILSEAMISVTGISGNVITFTADGEKPTAAIPCLATGIKGTSTGKIVGAFGSGGSSVDFYLNVKITPVAGAPQLSGVSVVATPSSGVALSTTTDANGLAQLMVKQGETYTVVYSKDDYTFNPNNVSITIQDTKTDLEAECYEAPKYTVTCTGTDKANRIVTATGSKSTIQGTTNANGSVTLTLGIDTYTITVDYPVGQGVSPASRSVTTTSGGVYTGSFEILDEPLVSVTVTDKSSGGMQSGRTITATPTSGSVVTATTSSGGVATLTLMSGKTYTISCDVPSGYIDIDSQTLTVTAGETYAVAFDLYKKATIVVTVGPDAIKSGRTVTATASGLGTVTGTTNSAGSCTLSVPAGSWSVTPDTPEGYYPSGSQTVTASAGQSYSLSFTMDAKPILVVNVDPDADANGLLVRAIGTTTITGYTNSSGICRMVLEEEQYTVRVTQPSAYLSLSAQSITAVRNQTYNLSFVMEKKPVVTVTVVDSSSAGYQSGRLISAVSSGETVTGTTNSSGVAVLTLNSTGSYTVSTDLPEGATADPVSITVDGGSTVNVTLTLSFGFVYGMTFNSSTFSSDPTGCLVYSDDCSGFTPVSNTATSLATVTTIGSWSMGNANNKLLKKCFYATFNDDGTISQILNPNNLAMNEDGGTSDITSKNTMFCIPTLYMNGSATGFTLSDKASEGQAFAHTIDGEVYDYLGIGVYAGYVTSSKLKSWSGVTPTRNTTRPNFRTYAKNNGSGMWMLTNYFHWKLWKELVFLATKSFDGQRKIGQGYTSGGSSNYGPTTGQCNAMGPFAGNVSGTTSQVKAFIEQGWGGSFWFIDDFVNNAGTVHVGQNSTPTDNTNNKTSLGKIVTSSGYCTQIMTTPIGWGMPLNSSGGDSTGLCDYHWSDTGSNYLGCVGGGSGSGAVCGPSCLSVNDGFSDSYADFGARLALLFNEGGA